VNAVSPVYLTLTHTVTAGREAYAKALPIANTKAKEAITKFLLFIVFELYENKVDEKIACLSTGYFGLVHTTVHQCIQVPQ
jgi:hypothetical protein